MDDPGLANKEPVKEEPMEDPISKEPVPRDSEVPAPRLDNPENDKLLLIPVVEIPELLASDD